MEIDSLENKEKPKISKDYKEKSIKLTLLGVFLFLTIILINTFFGGSFSNNKKDVPVIENNKVENIDIQEITDEDVFSGNYFEKTKKEIEKTDDNIEKIEEKVQEKNSLENSNNLNFYNEALKAYYEKLIQDEEQARTSGIGFSTNNSTNSLNTGNNSLENQGHVFSNNFVPDYYNQQNMQNEKRDFLTNTKQNKFYNSYNEENPISKYEVMAGTFIPATLITGINSDLPSNSVAIVRENVYDSVTGNFILIPKGTKIIGTYDSGVSFGQDRLLIIWQRLIFPNGKYIGLDNMSGVDLSGYAGFTGKVNNHFMKLLQAVVLSSAMGAGSAIVTDNGEDDWRTEAGKGAGQVILDFGNKMGEKIINRQPTIEIPQGYRFNITVQSDLVLSPYGG